MTVLREAAAMAERRLPGWALISDKAFRHALFLSSPFGTGLQKHECLQQSNIVPGRTPC